MDKQYRARRPPGQPSTAPQRQLRSTRRSNNSTLPGATTEIANQHGEDMREQDAMGTHGASVSATPREHYSSPYSTQSANYPQLPPALPQPNAHQGEVMMEQVAGPSHGYNAPIILQSQYRQIGPSPLSGHHTIPALPGFDNYVGRQMMNMAAHPHNGVGAPQNYRQQLRPATVSTLPGFDNYVGREMMNMAAGPHNGASAPQNYHQQLRPGPPINKFIPSAFTEFDTYGEEEMISDTELMKPQGTVPPPLPPSVEEAYRRKCIQLKQRMSEVEESNDASRSRLVRIQRAIEKMRLERAFLLEQLAKRTSTNVEDSEGSPSPPPTPKEKPLRTKRGHRKPSFMADLGDGRAGSTFIPQGPVTMSPSSDAFSHTHPEGSAPAAVRRAPSATNGVNHGAPKRPRTPFEFFVAEEKARHMADPVLRKEVESGAVNIENIVSNSWPNMSEDLRARWQAAFEEKKKQWDQEKEGTPQHAANITKPVQEDVEMADDAGSHSGGDGLGFTAVNRS